MHSDDDRARLQRASDEWRSKLIDFSRRNSLLYFTPRKTSTLDTPALRPAVERRLLDGKSVRVTELFDGADAVARALVAHKKRVENFEERGLSTLHAAFGVASWRPEDGGRPPAAPVLMLPLKSEPTKRGYRDVELTAESDPHINGVLMTYLEREYGIALDEEDLLAPQEEEGVVEPSLVLERLRRALGHRVPELRLDERFILGNFSFQKLAMVKDLASPEVLAASVMVSAIAGVANARAALKPREAPVDPRSLDLRAPAEDVGILDADSSQAVAIAAVLSGRSGVIQGPPGCGKSQTIANLIAALVERGRRVLFVAEKRAAIEVVLKRLQSAKLDPLLLDVASEGQKKRALAQRLAVSLEAARSVPPINHAALDARLADQRRALMDHARRVHEPQPPSLSPLVELEGELLALRRRGLEARTRWMRQSLGAMTPAVVADAQRELRLLAADAPLFVGEVQSPWMRAQLERPQQLEAALALVRRATSVALEAIALAREAASSARLRSPATMRGVRAMQVTMAELAEILARFDLALFREDLEAHARALEPGSKGWLSRLWAFLTSADYRRSLRTLRALTRGEQPGAPELFTSAIQGRDLLVRWRALAEGGALPANPPSARELQQRLDALDGLLGEARAWVELDEDPMLESLVSTFDHLDRESHLAHRIHGVQARTRALVSLGFAQLVEEIRRERYAPEGWADRARAAWVASCIEDIYLRVPEVVAFRGRAHDQIVADYQATDRHRLQANALRIRSAHGPALFHVMNQYPEQADVVQREAKKKTRNLGLRSLANEAPDVLTSLFPCWIASPLAVSNSIPPRPGLFDVVIFDEASQVLPEDAVTSLMRGKIAVVAGDRHQLPPTTFFADRDDGDDEPMSNDESGTAGFESLLDAMSTFLETWSLDWHYRSRDERLIAFSNHEVYDGRLVTFPSVGTESSIRHVLVPSGKAAGQGESSSDEVQRVVELIGEHARTRPDESLGVITLGIRHMQRIEAALDRAIDEDPILAAYWERQSSDERPFVKNLERVQGDERDAIILTVGYTKDASGHLPLRFGPILQDGGYRRLNVAITRARHRMTVVSSFDHRDLDPAKVRGRRGLELLRNYLEFAANRGERDTDRGMTGFPVNAFEADVQAALESRGLSCVPQLGVSSYRLDLAVRHPRQPGRFVLAVECDGASYHSAPTVRDRDRLRQQHLEALGWRFCRVWSTDWFQRREEEIARVVREFEDAVASIDAADADGPRAPAMPAVGALDVAPTLGDESIAADALRSVRKGPRPPVPQGFAIDEYDRRDLDRLAAWIRSDGRLRTDAELVGELMSELGFKRRGARIVATLEDVARRARQK
ncbi:AAA domain-containing protein [Myxococcota bacterium]|nr:AAA domain-containing protein [Myxococcota bacterium]